MKPYTRFDINSLVIQGKERALTFSIGTDALLQILPHIGALL